MSDSGLSEFQIALATLFFSLPESAGFLLAGGGALIAQGIVPRPAEDLDFFTARQLGRSTPGAIRFSRSRSPSQ